jgi:ribosomal protein S16
MRKYRHLVIRFRKNSVSNYRILEIVVILNKSKSTSRKIVEKLGFLHIHDNNFLTVNFLRLGYYLNRGVILNKKVKNVLSYFCFKLEELK